MDSMENLRLMIVDDDESALQSLKNTIQYNFNNLNIIAEANNVKDAINCVNIFKPDLLILDIILPDGYGFDILQSVTYKDFEVIITSSHPNFAVQAYEFSALHFIQKPVNLSSFQKAISRYKSFNTFEKLENKIKVAKELLNKTPENIMLPIDDTLSIYKLDEIMFFESKGNYLEVHFFDGKTKLLNRTLQKIDFVLKETQFVRTHNSFIINLNFLKSFQRGKTPYIILKNKKLIPLSESKKDDFISKLEQFAKIV